MKNILLSFALLTSFLSVNAQSKNANLILSDIDNFWNAYDRIATTKDTTEQYKYLNTLFLEKGSPGLKAIMEVRNYTAKSYLDAIHNYPQFWNSVRNNTMKASGLADSISEAIDRLRLLYPNLKPAKIYFTIGALRTGGTTLKDQVLIGSEISMADQNTITSEFPEVFAHLKPFFKSNPIHDVVFTNVHEYIHTQQKTTLASTLLGQTVLEGVAEFVAVLASGQKSPLPALTFGKSNEEWVRHKFAQQLYNPFNGFWLYSNAGNEFHQRDLGYYVGYEICERFYKKAKDKKQAIAEMIELNYDDARALDNFVEKSGYFKKSITQVSEDFKQNRPTVLSVVPFNNQADNIDSKLTQITITFSAQMDKSYRNFELGPLGETNLLRIKRFNGFSEDGKSASFEVELQPDKQYQIIIGSGFRSTAGVSLKPYLLAIKTGK
ncbi:MAG: hypothetical protein EOO20_16745 [Chryseobacterium sp.]|nr:MAG: hypothetical protein EOO20_16745 [Chryseobacterium sp.]